MKFSVRARVVDAEANKIFAAEIFVEHGLLKKLVPLPAAPAESLPYALPGFIDAHVHIESSMLVPTEFARLAVVHGTVATVSDPHEIANVCGMAGVDFMIDNGNTVPFHFFFGAPSCVPATTFETAGATLDAGAVLQLLQRKEILYLSEFMNFPGVINGAQEVLKKLDAARLHNKPVDGHAPGLRGADLKKYIAAGISTDHECFTADEALEKLSLGMQVIIREGSAAKNFDALAPLLHKHFKNMMFCSDDKHPDSLAEGHINTLCARAAALGVDVFKIVQVACINPVRHYCLPVGLLREGDAADFILTHDLENFTIDATYIKGVLVAQNGETKIARQPQPAAPPNHFHCTEKMPADFEIPFRGEAAIPVIEAFDGQLITGKLFQKPMVQAGCVMSDKATDTLKLVVVNRYRDAPVAKAFIRSFGLRRGALASSVAHDSHNIIAVGVDDEAICRAVNAVIAHRGGISVADENGVQILPLPVAGLMSLKDGYAVAEKYAALDAEAKGLGASLAAPFMTLSFMALLVIPKLKLSDLGLFDGENFCLA